MKTLTVTHEVELVRLDTVQRKREFNLEKQKMELQLLRQKTQFGDVIVEEDDK